VLKVLADPAYAGILDPKDNEAELRPLPTNDPAIPGNCVFPFHFQMKQDF
jgi:hypothetical protein